MVMLSIVEAAGLSGLSPERVRELIRFGQLAAQEIPLPDGVAYLIESTELGRVASVRPDSAALADSRDPHTAQPDALKDALASLRASLARRQQAGAAGIEQLVAGSVHPAVQVPTVRRTAGGLDETELRSLAARVDRLLVPAPATQLSAEAETRRQGGVRWWRRLVPRTPVSAS